MKNAKELKKQVTPKLVNDDLIFAEYMEEIEAAIVAQAKLRGKKPQINYETTNKIFFNRVYLVKILKELYAAGYDVTYDFAHTFDTDFDGRAYQRTYRNTTINFTITW